MSFNRVAFERGRNDRRDGKKLEDFNLSAIFDRNFWEAGHAYQESVFKKDRAYTFNRGRDDARKKIKDCPYPVGTTAFNEWQRGVASWEADQEKKQNADS